MIVLTSVILLRPDPEPEEEGRVLEERELKRHLAAVRETTFYSQFK